MNQTGFNVQESMPRVAKSLRIAAIKRNAKTALFLGVASSGAIIGASALAVTAVGSFATLYVWDYFQSKKN